MGLVVRANEHQQIPTKTHTHTHTHTHTQRLYQLLRLHNVLSQFGTVRIWRGLAPYFVRFNGCTIRLIHDRVYSLLSRSEPTLTPHSCSNFMTSPASTHAMNVLHVASRCCVGMSCVVCNATYFFTSVINVSVVFVNVLAVTSNALIR